MAKLKSELVSQFGILASIIIALVNAVRKQGGTDEDIRRLATPEGESIVEEIAAILVKKGKKARESLTLIVDLTASIPALPAKSQALAPNDQDPTSPFGFQSLHAPLQGGQSLEMIARLYTLPRNMIFSEMVESAGDEEEIRGRHVFTPEQIRYLVDQQKNGENGKLLNNGYANFFFVLAGDGSLAVVCVSWSARYRYWDVWSDPASYPRAWAAGGRLFLRA